MTDSILKLKYEQWCSEQRRIMQPADFQGRQGCVRCGFCCMRKACIPTPEELVTIAGYFQMQDKQFFNVYMVVDIHQDIRHPRFANTKQYDVTGMLLEPLRTYDQGQCLMYSEEQRECTIYAVQPKHAKVYQCWTDRTNKDALEALHSWNASKAQQYLDALLTAIAT